MATSRINVHSRDLLNIVVVRLDYESDGCRIRRVHLTFIGTSSRRKLMRLQNDKKRKSSQLMVQTRQNKFTTNKQKSETGDSQSCEQNPVISSGKRGAPTGHVGWYRKTPTQYDIRVDVPAPTRCPHARQPMLRSTNLSQSVCLVVTKRDFVTITTAGGSGHPTN